MVQVQQLVPAWKGVADLFISLDPLGFLSWLLTNLAPSIKFRRWLDTRTVPFPGEPDRTCDTVAELIDEMVLGVWWALVIEFPTRPDLDLFGRLLEYLGRLWQILRPSDDPQARFEVVAAVINLTGIGRTSRQMEFKPGLVTSLQVAERNLSQEEAGPTLAAIASGQVCRSLLAWIPLMRGGAESDTIEQWKQLAQAEPETRRRSDYAGLALVFAELAGCRDPWKAALEGWNVEQSQQVLEWQAIAEKRGEAKGRAEGEAKGRAEGEAKGEAKGKAESVLRLLSRRLKVEIPQDLAASVRGTMDPALLDAWLDAVLTVNSLEEFRKMVNP